jgi:hypothetical protein
MRTACKLGLWIVWLAGVAVVANAGADGPERVAADLAGLRAHQAERLEAARLDPDGFEAQLAAAEGLLRGADRLRNERKIRDDMPDGQEAEYRAAQKRWSEEAMPFAERARALAGDDAQRAQAERVIGELYAHQITGMISGMLNGPRARRHIGNALELAPDDPECQRAIGLMYLNNPPISGGDVPKAIETFGRCAAESEDERCLVLLAMSHRKAGDPAQAREAAAAALERDPDSMEAKLLLEVMP